MTRWQDRGEVLDSDDEELSLGADSQSPERARKKRRLDDGTNTANGDFGAAGKNTDEEDAWLQPKSLKTYGKRAPSLTLNASYIAEHGSERESDGIDDTNRGLPAAPRQGEVEGILDENIRAGSSQSNDSEGLPDVRQILAGYVGTRLDQAGQNDKLISSAVSSPLSECEVSPPPIPAAFRFPRLGQSPEPNVPHAAEPSDEDDSLSNEEVPLDEAQTFIAGRRNLRARKEKQLHPYMFDKAQYQKQFRERGLRPVRYVETDDREAETQEAASSSDESGSLMVHDENNSSPARPSSMIGDSSATSRHQKKNISHEGSRERGSGSDDELPDTRDSHLQATPGRAPNGFKGRKLLHKARLPGPMTSLRSSTLLSGQHDEFSVPPSPPPTSSDSIASQTVGPRPGGFRMPRGVTPLPLPTPQISSDVRGRRNDTEDDPMGIEFSPRRSRPSTNSRSRPQPVMISSSSESSDTESEAELEDRRLQKERKRIKGVLPASWLKIDFRAQQKHMPPSPVTRRRLSSPSPPRTMPQKGVAQRVMATKARSPTRPESGLISDDETESDGERPSISPPTLEQSKLQFNRAYGTAAPSNFVDVDQMEVDWVDPMFTTSSGHARKMPRKKHQPRITDAFQRSHKDVADYGEERKAMRDAVAPRRSRTMTKKKSSKRPRRQHPPVEHLSIVDIPEYVNLSEKTLPPFVRLALRTASARPGYGRHSPTHKHIRLPTREDTESATAMLSAWREGTISRRDIAPSFRIDKRSTIVVHEGEDDLDRTTGAKTPLAEISPNKQSILPPPLRSETKVRERSEKATGLIRQPNVRQTRLRPVVIWQDRPTSQVQTHEADISKSAVPIKANQKTFRVQPQFNRFREAQLESLETEFDLEHRAAAFERRMHLLTEKTVGLQKTQRICRVSLQRFLHDPDATTMTRSSQGLSEERVAAQNQQPNLEIPAANATLPHRPRKRQTYQVNAEAREYRQPSEPLPGVVDLEDEAAQTALDRDPVVHGLGGFGTRHATDFDIVPLAVGTYFHQTTFVGSGDFAASLDSASRDLDTPTGRMTIHVADDILECGAWTEELAAGLARIPAVISDGVGSLNVGADTNALEESVTLVSANVEYLLRSVVRYFARCVTFLDPVDRTSCIQRLLDLAEHIGEAANETGISAHSSSDISLRCLQYSLVLVKQAQILSDHQMVRSELNVRCPEMVNRAVNRLARHLFPSCLTDLRTFYEDNRHVSKRERGIQDSDTPISCLVVLYHVLDDSTGLQSSFWATVYRAIGVDASSLSTVPGLDRAWYDIFTVLPILEMDATGIARVGSRMQGCREDWSMVKTLLLRLFEIYPATASWHGSTINDYVRATLNRCFRLINNWGWWACEPILGTMFDFFARRGLASLQREESRGSPRFLEDLDSQPSLEIQPEDLSFHLFLKVLASSLLGMSKHGVYSDKKIGGIAWRFIPNHGRTYRKDSEVRQDDIDALRNHHDLLCTLYYASPAGHRLRVELIQNLVDHSASHREACRLNVKAWSNVAGFQLSTSEDLTRLDALIAWFREIIRTTISQYRLARTEVERDVASARAQESTFVSTDIVEDTIARNQRQISATLVDALAALKGAIRKSSNLSAASYLLEKSIFWSVFDLYDPSSRRLCGMLNEALAVVKAALAVESRFVSSGESQHQSDDSQDYGDSIALQTLASNTSQTLTCGIADVLHAPASQLVSNIFGADAVTDDAVLTDVIDVWILLAQRMVCDGKKSWINYISDYSSDAWFQLRDTGQRRKYTPYFLARLAETSNVNVLETSILVWWFISLVEREAMLKFQHVLTNALLSRNSDEPLLHNLPFTRHASSRFHITLQELRQRRASLLSSVLSNMRRTFDRVMHEEPRSLPALRRTYIDMLKQLMQAMKKNYQQLETSHGEHIVDHQARGAYVEFVQQIVSFLQQYTADICQVDRFFTDSANFPLPATDPMYVVGRLRAYVPKLAEGGKRKELAGFIQTVSERAAVDGQQVYLVDQLVTAMGGVVERGDDRAPSLRHVLMTSVFPAYIESSFSTPSSWIIAKPIILACGRVADELLYDTMLNDERSVHAVQETLLTLLDSMKQPIKQTLTYPGLLVLPHVQNILTSMFDTARSCFTIALHIEQASNMGNQLEASLDQFYKSAASIEKASPGLNEDIIPDNFLLENEVQCSWLDTREFTRKQLDKLKANWYVHEGLYYMKRGNSSVEVPVGLQDENEERMLLAEALKQFRESYQAIFSRQRRELRPTQDNCGIGGLLV